MNERDHKSEPIVWFPSIFKLPIEASSDTMDLWSIDILPNPNGLQYPTVPLDVFIDISRHDDHQKAGDQQHEIDRVHDKTEFDRSIP